MRSGLVLFLMSDLTDSSFIIGFRLVKLTPQALLDLSTPLNALVVDLYPNGTHLTVFDVETGLLDLIDLVLVLQQTLVELVGV